MSAKRNFILIPATFGLVAVSAVVISQGFPDSASAAKVQTGLAPAPEKIGFNAHVRPILSDKCFACHGFDSTKREEDLRLDTAEGAYAALKSDPSLRAIVPGKPKESVALQRILTNDPDDIMPPPDYHKPLSEQEKQIITRWIEQGAEYQEHWAFAPIVKPEVPKAEAKHPIDAFVRDNLKKHKLKPTSEADKATLLRRLSLDLIGLPPTTEELEAFLTDSSPDAYEKQVERLLASPRYGERMAVSWLDAVRYADTVGYHGDQNSRIFPYRDYVINSFNANKPFDQFTREQLAGDLMPNPTEEQKIATGFLRLNLMTREGGAQDKEYLAKYAGDRVRAIGGAWLGLTTGCAECHNHKFDPFTMRDFYSMAAFFNDLRQWGIYTTYNNTPNPDLPGFNNESPFPPELFAKNKAVQVRLEKARDASVDAVKGMPVDENRFKTWHQSAKKFITEHPSGWLPLKAASIARSGASNNPPAQSDDAAILISGAPVPKDEITVDYELPPGTLVKSLRLEVLPHKANNDRIGRRPDGKFSVLPVFFINQTRQVMAYQQADRRTPARYNDGYQSPLLEETWQSAPAIFEEPANATSIPHHAHYHLKQSFISNETATLTLKMRSDDIGKFRLSVSLFADPVPGEPNAHRPALAEALKGDGANSSELKAAFILSTVPDDKLPAQYTQARTAMLNSHAGYAHSMIAQALPADKIPQGHMLPRGDWMNPGEKVDPAFPAFLTKEAPPAGKRLSRMDLANWLLAPENPMTSRHFTNRLWKQFFGKGFSNILDDLGNQGEWPSNPQLIDWLAAEFQNSGWNVKHMVRLIVTSETYRQAAAKNPQLAEIDPDNRLLSEQSARRLDAEFVRDNALAISGLLRTDEIGGPSILPYQSEDYWENLNFPERKYISSKGTDQYRRGLYVHWQRTFIHPMMAAFDAPSREECAADRFQSNSPQQALALLNDPSFNEAAKAFARRIHVEAGNRSDAEKIERAYLLALSRKPSEQETSNLVAFLEKIRKEDPKVDAMEQLCRVILNLHETITRY
jgi:hypothetical protein